MSLDGKRVLVTGGASGIGQATAELFAEQGATVVVADVAEESGRRLVDRLGSRHRFVRLDVSSKDEWDRHSGEIAGEQGLDLVLLNAGLMTRPHGEPIFNDPLPWLTPERVGKLVGVNVYGVLWGILACLPHVKKRKGTILATSSAAGIQPYPMDPTYSMTKFAVLGLASALAPTLAKQGVRIVTVCPNGIDTPMCPPDLHAKKISEGTFSPPSHMAAAILHIYDRAKPGEIWLGRANQEPYRYEPAPLTPPATRALTT